MVIFLGELLPTFLRIYSFGDYTYLIAKGQQVHPLVFYGDKGLFSSSGFKLVSLYLIVNRYIYYISVS